MPTSAREDPTEESPGKAKRAEADVSPGRGELLWRLRDAGGWARNRRRSRTPPPAVASQLRPHSSRRRSLRGRGERAARPSQDRASRSSRGGCLGFRSPITAQSQGRQLCDADSESALCRTGRASRTVSTASARRSPWRASSTCVSTPVTPSTRSPPFGSPREGLAAGETPFDHFFAVRSTARASSPRSQRDANSA